MSDINLVTVLELTVHTYLNHSEKGKQKFKIPIWKRTNKSEDYEISKKIIELTIIEFSRIIWNMIGIGVGAVPEGAKMKSHIIRTRPNQNPNQIFTG